MDDRAIVALYWQRNEDALRITEEKYGVRLQALAYGIVGDRQTAEECENDTYLEAWQSIPPHRPEDYFYAFLACITRRNALNRCRERDALKRRGHIMELSAELQQCIPAADDTARCVDELALRQALNGFLATLSREKRCIFLRRYWYMDSVAEISQRFAISESKVKTTLLRCRRQLRVHLEKEGLIQ